MDDPVWGNRVQNALLCGIVGKDLLRKIPNFHLICLCGNFMEKHSFRRECHKMFKDLFITTKVNEWISQLEPLTKIAAREP